MKTPIGETSINQTFFRMDVETHEWKMMKDGQVSQGKLDCCFYFQILFALNHGAVGALVVTLWENAEIRKHVHIRNRI